jgi:hypothetical protein
MRERERACLLVRIAGTVFLGIGLSHFFVPALFHWRETLPASAPVELAGETINNAAFVYLFNADLLLYEVMLATLSFYAAGQLRQGKRMALVFSAALAAFFLLRTPLQFLYFPFTWSSIVQATGSFLIACLYAYPLLRRRAFLEP